MEIEYFENIKLNQKKFLGEYISDRDEIIEYARKSDPQPFHIDEEEAKRLKRETCEPMVLSRFEIVPTPEHLRSNLNKSALMEFSYEAAQSIYDTPSEYHVEKIAPRPIQLIHPADDNVVPSSKSMEIFNHSGQPTEPYLIAGEDHFPLLGKDPKSPLIIKLWLDRFFPAKS